MQYTTPVLGVLLALAILAGSVSTLYFNHELQSTQQNAHTRTEELTAEKDTLAAELAQKEEEAITLAGELRREQQKTGDFERQLRQLSGAVGTLEKLAYTDSELLAKYSKVYFLNENYVPTKLATIPTEFSFQEGRTYEFHANAIGHLEDLLDDAKEDGLSLRIVSAYRSFDTQAALKSSYTVRYGTGANAFSADQGYSEHQLGTTVDFTTPTSGGAFNGFDATKEYTWLTENAWRYGFVLSYPKGNSYYQYEPWHWRFVGLDLARHLNRTEQNFYDLDQRAIDEYLADLFD